MRPLIASVPPLLERPVVQYARKAAFHLRSVRPSRAISGIGQDGKVASTFSAALRPAGRSLWW